MNTTIDVTVRRARSDDIEQLLPLVRSYRVFYGQEPDAASERRFVAKHLRDATSTVFVANAGGETVGFVQIFESWSTVRLAPVLILEDLFVEPGWRKRGIARSLIGAALAYARENGAAAMFLETAAENQRAQSVYERAGWLRERIFVKFNAPL
ncbi:MAG TPA: GNAT family N-acetyltransferase [Candidatus Baltobacteraceae bacterium]|nr:GNAT family N-acetyltransferase [Candidatus Baltobacteraceae bacterium]